MAYAVNRTAEGFAIPPSTTPGVRRGSRRGLDRAAVLRAALDLVDREGADALTMRAVATELGVDPMTLYRHVDNKEALLDGIVEQLWAQVPARAGEHDWKAMLATLARDLRAVVVAHPRAAPLLLSRPVVPRSTLELYRDLLGVVQAAGFDERHAAAIVRCVSSVALSDAALQVNYGQPLRDAGGAEHGGDPGPEQWISMAQLLPSDTPPELVRVAWAVCAPMDDNDDFAFAVELILAGAERLAARP